MANEPEVPPVDPAPTPAKVIRGYIDCPLCLPLLVVATVMETKHRKLYFNCPVHQVQLMTNGASQQWLHDHMRDTPQLKLGDPYPDPAPEPAPAPKPAPKPTPKKKDWWD